jgi:hypothetical protein
MLKTSLAVKLPSLAVTLISMLPALEAPGVPAKVRVVGLNDSHDDKADPLAVAAEYVSAALSTSVNALMGNVYVKRDPANALWSGKGKTTDGASFTATT